MKYKLSRYNIYKFNTSQVLVFNTFSGALVQLNKFEYNSLLNFQDAKQDDSVLKEWIQLGLIVDNNIDEIELVNYCRFRDTFSKQKSVYRILTTSYCNAKCYYCYEDGFKRENMNKDTARDVACFIVNNSKNKQNITLNWFGGEPLMNPDVISIITDGVYDGLKDSSVKINSTIITNGSLFSNELIDIAKSQWKINNIQISLDGLKKEHELRKNYINFQNSFERTLDIIGKLLAREMNVSIRLNYDLNNVRDILAIIPFIRKLYGKTPHLHCYAYPLFDNIDSYFDSFIRKDKIADYNKMITQALYENGYFNLRQALTRKTIGCFAVQPDSFVINTNGDLFKCSMDMKCKSSSIGNIYEQINLSSKYIKWCNPILPQKCNDCIALPLCQGGCRTAQLWDTDENYCSLKLNTLDFSLSKMLDNSINQINHKL